MIELSSTVLTVGIVPHGARVARLAAPDRDGVSEQVVLGLAEEDYPADTSYLGATVGRYANRIAGGRFVLDGHEYRVPPNEAGNALHGGPDAFEHAEWVADPVSASDDGASVTLHHTSPDGENGFPGTLEVAVTYTVTGADLVVDLVAGTDAPTVLNLTNHSYFTLRGRPVDVGDHEVVVLGERYLPVDADLLPTGELAPVRDTRFDLRTPSRLDTHPGDGFDHTWVLPPTDGELRVAAHVHDPVSGRSVALLTDRPGVQFYTGTMLDGSLALHGGGTAARGQAFCLEPQHFPDSPNRRDFPSTVLRPGQTWRTRSVYRFGTGPWQP